MRLEKKEMDKLRDEFFEKHVSFKTTDGIPMVSTHPHNLFEWFKTKINNTCECENPNYYVVENDDSIDDYCKDCGKCL